MDIIQKTKRDYNRIAKYFANTRQFGWPEFEVFKRYIKNGQNILDWGCGSGRLLDFLSKKNINYFGVDISRELLKIARAKFKKQIKEGKAKFILSARGSKRFPEDFFDLVFMVASFHHLPDEKSRRYLLNDIYSQLKTNGKLIMTVWNLESDWAKSKLHEGWKLIGQNDYLIPWKNPEGEILAERYYHHFTEGELKRLLQDAGFKVKKIGFNGFSNWSDKKGGRNLVVLAVKS